MKSCRLASVRQGLQQRPRRFSRGARRADLPAKLLMIPISVAKSAGWVAASILLIDAHVLAQTGEGHVTPVQLKSSLDYNCRGSLREVRAGTLLRLEFDQNQRDAGRHSSPPEPFSVTTLTGLADIRWGKASLQTSVSPEITAGGDLAGISGRLAGDFLGANSNFEDGDYHFTFGVSTAGAHDTSLEFNVTEKTAFIASFTGDTHYFLEGTLSNLDTGTKVNIDPAKANLGVPTELTPGRYSVVVTVFFEDGTDPVSVKSEAVNRVSGTFSWNFRFKPSPPTPNPVIFIHGVTGSFLVDGPPNGDQLWLGAGPIANRLRLTLFPNEFPPGSSAIAATDVIRFLLDKRVPLEDNRVYGPFLDQLVATGKYREYTTGGNPALRTCSACDKGQLDPDPTKNKNLFVFVYDWRLSNIENAAKLADFVCCVRQFHPDRDIDVVTHSMGSLLARRYILDHPADHHVAKLITVAAPWLGSPKILHVMETGEFIRVFGIAIAAGPELRHVMPSFRSVHQLLSSKAYFDLGGAPILVEEGSIMTATDATRRFSITITC